MVIITRKERSTKATVAEMQKTELMDSEYMARRVLSGILKADESILTPLLLLASYVVLYVGCCLFSGPAVLDGL